MIQTKTMVNRYTFGPKILGYGVSFEVAPSQWTLLRVIAANIVMAIGIYVFAFDFVVRPFNWSINVLFILLASFLVTYFDRMKLKKIETGTAFESHLVAKLFWVYYILMWCLTAFILGKAAFLFLNKS